jgi:anaerobic magnesium-protoporphyrin IX monomethyl ester cyclase
LRNRRRCVINFAAMRVLFIYKDVTLTEPLGVLYLAAALRRAGHEASLALADRRHFRQQAQDFEPDILAYSVTTGYHQFYVDLNRDLKAALTKPVLSVFGGPHATFFPEFVEEEGVDVVCRGEGEEAMVELADYMSRGDDYRRVRNLWVKENGAVRRNDVRPLVADLDALPFPARDILYDYDKYMRGVTMKHFFPMRGCPYLCTYCFNHKYNQLYRGKGQVLRWRSVDNVLAEIKEVREGYPLKFVRFLSDNFTNAKEWVAEFADKYRGEVGLPFHCNVRANMVDEKVARDLARAGCVSVLLGIETGDDGVRNDLLKRNMSRETIVAACRYLRENGVNVYASNMIGLPGETFEQALETLKLNQECRPAFAWSALFMPYPRTELTEYAVRRGYFDGDPNAVFHTFHDHSVLRFRSEKEGRMLANLHKLFGVMVEWPFLARFARALCRVPANPLYKTIFTLWYGYTNRRRIFPYPLGVKGFVAGVKRFFRKDQA